MAVTSQPTRVHLEFLNVLWDFRKDGGYVPQPRSVISRAVNERRVARSEKPLSPSTVSVVIAEMREKNLLLVYRLNEDGTAANQVSPLDEKEYKKALAARDNRTAYAPAVNPTEVSEAAVSGMSELLAKGGSDKLLGEDQRAAVTKGLWEVGHNRFLQDLAKPLFEENYTLPEVFIKPAGYWTERPLVDEKKQEEPGKAIRHLVEVLPVLEQWWKDNRPADTVRILEGPPGSGKSSTARMFARHCIEAGDHVMYVPLHRLRLVLGNVGRTLDAFAAEAGYPDGVLDPAKQRGRVLLILDGLDELAQQGEGGQRAARKFAEEVKYALEQRNTVEPRVSVLFCGRPISATDAADVFPDARNTIHLLPYFVPEKERQSKQFAYEGDMKLLEQDQRDTWWQQNHAKVMPKESKEMPAVLKNKKLEEFTAQPLLNHLLAIAYRDRNTGPAPKRDADDPVPPSPFIVDQRTKKETPPERMADVYAWLLRKVYDRECAEKERRRVLNLSFREFRDLLGCLGLAAWHGGSSRATSVKAVEKLCEPLGLSTQLNTYKNAFAEGTVGLFVSFYFRHAERVHGAEETFEFTLKPFAEYLAAVGLVSALGDYAERLGKPKFTGRRGGETWSAQELLLDLLQVAGPGEITQELYEQIKGEVARRTAQEDENFAKVGLNKMVELLNDDLKNGLPAHQLEGFTFPRMTEHARRTEHAILCLLGGCEQATRPEWPDGMKAGSDEHGRWLEENLLRIEWPSTTAAAELIHRVRLQQAAWAYRTDPLPLGRFELRGHWLHGCDLGGAILSGASLYAANLNEASLDLASLDGASLSGASLYRASLHRASLAGAFLAGATLDRAFLAGASLDRANLHEASLAGAFLVGASLDRANLHEASLEGATYGDIRLDTPEGRKFLKKGGAILDDEDTKK